MAEPLYTQESATVGDLVRRLATEEDETPSDPIFIPSLQREFTWDHHQIVDLFDSLLVGLPINALLLWKVDGPVAAEEATYQFIKHYAEKSAYPTDKKYEKDGTCVRNKSNQLTTSDQVPSQYTFALDGQQRLTSFLIGLQGTHYRYKSQRWKSKLSSYTERELYMDILSSPFDKEDIDDDPQYQFKFRTTGGNLTDKGAYWWPVHRIMELDDLEDEINQIQDLVPGEEEKKLIRHNLTRLYDAIHEHDHLIIEHVSNMDSKVALELFVRRNAGGDPLSNSDIAFSQMAVYWTSEEQDPKQAIESYVDELGREFADYGFSFGKGFIIRSLLMLAEHPPSFRREYLIAQNIRDLEDVWLNPSYKRAMHESFRLVSEELDLGSKCLTSNSAVLPIIYHCFKHLNETGATDVDIDGEILTKMEYWLAVTVCNNLFSLGSDTVLRRSQDHITPHSFPVRDILEEFRGRGIETQLSEDRLELLINETNYQSGTVKHLLLTKAYTDDRISGKLVERKTSDGGVVTNQMQVDHIYPLKKLNPDTDEELSARGLSFEDKSNRHQLGNLQLIPENQSKGDMDPKDWIKKRIERGDISLEELVDEHVMPWSDPEDYSYSQYNEFWQTRESELFHHLRSQLTLYEDIR